MKISKNDLEKLQQEGIITSNQVEQIINFYQKNNVGNKLLKRLFVLASLLISLGIILIISANWALIPNFVKIGMDFILFLLIVYADYYFITNNKTNLAETFLVLSFFMVAATIGLIAQVYNLDGGWLSFARFWMILAIPFVCLSKTNLINILWIVLLFNSLPDSFYTFMKDFYYQFTENILLFSQSYNVSIFWILVYFILELIYFIAMNLYKKFNKKIMLLKSFSILLNLSMFCIASYLAIFEKNALTIIFIFCLLAYKMYKSFKLKKIISFRNSVILTELYVIYLFVSAYGNLFFTGMGFIIGGILLLLSIYILRKTMSYIKNLEEFNEK